MSFANITSLSTLGVVGQAIRIYFSSPLLFLWYALPPLVFRPGVVFVDGDGPMSPNGALMALAGILFLDNLLLVDGWMAHQTATFYAKDVRCSSQSKITIQSANGRALACVQVLVWLRVLAGSRSALLSLAVIPVVKFWTSFIPVIIAVEGKSIGDAARRSASITKQMYWTFVQFCLYYVVAYSVIGLLLGLTLIDLGVSETESKKFVDPASGIIMASGLIVAPLITISQSVLYFQHRAQKEGLTVEKLACELYGEGVFAEKSVLRVADEYDGATGEGGNDF